MGLTERAEDRHPGVRQLVRWLEPNPRLPDLARRQAEAIEEAAARVLEYLGDGPELTAGLRHLLEAKDCFVRQALADQEATAASIEGRPRRKVTDNPQA
jgi:hypothetical protein